MRIVDEARRRMGPATPLRPEGYGQRGGRTGAVMLIRITDSFPAAHRIRIDTRGTLEPVHVHHWRVSALVEAGNEPVREGARAREAVRAWTARYRGRSLNDVEPYGEINPTAEEVARHLARELAAQLPGQRVVAVTIGEAAGFSATYTPGEDPD